jgi:hypothetical protein
MIYTAKCAPCQQQCLWIECPTGGWWSHIIHPDDGHNADPGWRPAEDMDDHGYWHTLGFVDTVLDMFWDLYFKDWWKLTGLAAAINRIGVNRPNYMHGAVSATALDRIRQTQLHGGNR